MKKNITGHHRFSRQSELARLQKWNIAETSERVFFATTPDGWQLAISHYRDNRLNPATRRYPVLLCHGLGANRLVFDIDRQHSFSAWLLGQGYDVYAVDLRSHGLSEKPGMESGKQWGWGFNEYCDFDIPTVIDAVLTEAGADALHFVGHSMGGILLYCHAAQSNARIVSGITIGSTLDYSGHPSVFHRISPLAALTYMTPSMPMHWPALFCSKATALSKNFIDSTLVNPGNVDRHVYRKLTANLLHPVSSRLLRDMKQFTNGNGVMSSSQKRYDLLLKNKGYAFPILSISGEADTQCHPASAARFGTHHQVFGTPHGHKSDYGHLDLIMGTHAHEEVWPCMGSWLSQHDQPAAIAATDRTPDARPA